jgi:hypothetical protein
MKIIDYYFLRIYCFYKKFKDSTPIWMGCCVLTVITGLSFLTLNTIITLITKGDFFINSIVLIGIATISLFVFWKRYGNDGKPV